MTATCIRLKGLLAGKKNSNAIGLCWKNQALERSRMIKKNETMTHLSIWPEIPGRWWESQLFPTFRIWNIRPEKSDLHLHPWCCPRTLNHTLDKTHHQVDGLLFQTRGGGKDTKKNMWLAMTRIYTYTYTIEGYSAKVCKSWTWFTLNRSFESLFERSLNKYVT